MVEVAFLPRLLCLVSSEPTAAKTSCVFVRGTGAKIHLLSFLLEMPPIRLRNSVYNSPCQPQISSFYFPFQEKETWQEKLSFPKQKQLTEAGAQIQVI